jgi:hypothetical protein
MLVRIRLIALKSMQGIHQSAYATFENHSLLELSQLLIQQLKYNNCKTIHVTMNYINIDK